MTQDPGTGLSVANMTETAATVDVALYYDHDCPLAGPLRGDVVNCLTELGMPFVIHEHLDEERLSPTLLIGGVDVLDPLPPGSGCRLERPSAARIRDAVARATGSGSV